MRSKKLIFTALSLAIACAISVFLPKKTVAKTFANETTPSISYSQVEYDVTNSALVGTVTNSVDAIRFLMTDQAGVTANHLAIYFGLKETVDLTDTNTYFNLQVRALKNVTNDVYLDTKIKIYLVDENGTIVAGRNGTADVTFEDSTKGSVDCSNTSGGTSYAYQGFSCNDASIGKAVRTYHFNKNNFINHAPYNTNSSVIDYSKITQAIIEVWTPIDNGSFYQFEIMNMSVTQNEVETNLFSATDATEGTSRNVTTNQWYFDSIPSQTPYTEQEKTNIPVIVEQVKANDGEITTFNASTNNSVYHWLRSYRILEDGSIDKINLNAKDDYSKYDRISFDLDTSLCTTDIPLQIKLFWADDSVSLSDENRFFRSVTNSFYYMPENGEPFYYLDANESALKAGFKGKVFVDLSTFLQDGVAGSSLSVSHQSNVSNTLRFIFNPRNNATFNGKIGVSKFTINNIKFIDAQTTTLNIEKIHGLPSNEYFIGTSIDDILKDYPNEIAVTGSIIKTLNLGTKTIEEVTQKTFVQINGSWSATELTNNQTTLTFNPNSNMNAIFDNYTFENGVSFTINATTNKQQESENPTPPSDTPTTEKKGCNSSITGCTILSVIILASALVLLRRKKNG